MTWPKRYKKVTCTYCDSDGKITDTCPDCGGSGKFKTVRTKNIVTCRRCKGTGEARQKCFACKGRLFYKVEIPAKYKKCLVCNGTGKKMKFNPVVSASAVEALMKLKTSLCKS
jgi:DnaJ-class molecular chaperone